MELNDFIKLPNEIVEHIIAFKEEKLKSVEKEGIKYNSIIREDIMQLLDSQCKIVYYPKSDNNNGFHKTYHLNDESLHFVYINTNQEIEKQNFTAAHELGHIWQVDEYLKNKTGIETNPELNERIMNRFAAELLMPQEIFLNYLKNDFFLKEKDADEITIKVLIQVITDIMNEFYVPYKAVVIRMFELDIIGEGLADILLNGNDELPKENLLDYSKQYAKEQGYFRLNTPNRLKHIAGLKDYLDVAKEKGNLPEKWLEAFYNRFEYDQSEPSKSLQKEVSLENHEENK